MPIAQDMLYFHARYRRESPTQLGRDFEILPRTMGCGRFVGTCIAVRTDPLLRPELVGRGRSQGVSGRRWGAPDARGHRNGGLHRHRLGAGLLRRAIPRLPVGRRRQGANGRSIASTSPDPVYFARDCRLTLQQMGGLQKQPLQELARAGATIRLVSYRLPGAVQRVNAMEPSPPIELDDAAIPPDAWCNFPPLR